MLLPLVGYFLCMITVLAAAAGAMIGLFQHINIGQTASLSAPRPTEDRLFSWLYLKQKADRLRRI